MRLPVALTVFVLGTVAFTPPVAAQDSFIGFIAGLRDACHQQPAQACTSQTMEFLDNDGDDRVSLREFESVRSQAQATVTDQNSPLSKIERNLITVSLLILNQAKLPAVFANFDNDGDGHLGEDELFADFTIGARPFGEIVADPAAVNWNSFAQRFGKVGFLITDLLPPSHRN